MNNPMSGTDPTGYLSVRGAQLSNQHTATVTQNAEDLSDQKYAKIEKRDDGNVYGTTSDGDVYKLDKILISNGAGNVTGVFQFDSNTSNGTSSIGNQSGGTNQNFGAPVYYDATVNGGEFDDIPGSNDSTEKITDVRQRIADLAESKEGDESYAFDSKKGRFPKESWKCNKFVYDILKDAGVDVPLNPGGDWPLQANGWAQKTTKIPGWIVVDKPMPGDIAAIPRKGTGHVGVYIRNQWGSDVMAANKDGVSWSQSHLRNDWLNSAANATGNTVYRRYVGTK